MPSSSSQSQQSRELKKRRQEQFEQINKIVDTLENKLVQTRKQIKQRELLDSVSQGLYDEIDKLTKKAPAEPITDLVLEQTNDVIKETKQLIASDSYVQRLNQFVAAGDNPQHRDVVIVLRQIRQGLARFETDLQQIRSAIDSLLSEAITIQIAIGWFLDGRNVEGDTALEREGFDTRFGGLNEDLNKWFIGSRGNRKFDYAKLDDTDLEQYFPKILN